MVLLTSSFRCLVHRDAPDTASLCHESPCLLMHIRQQVNAFRKEFGPTF